MNKIILKFQLTQEQECFNYTLFRETPGIETDRKPSTMYRIVSQIIFTQFFSLLPALFLQVLALGFMKNLHIF